MELRIAVSAIALLAALNFATASECGESTIPYSLEVLPSGQPILGCARPTCFGYSPDGHQLPTTAKFFRIDQQSDGFLRDDPLAIHTFDAADPRVYGQQKATCETEFQSLSCESADQWVGGIAPVMNATATTVVAYQCCTYAPLRASIDRGVATVAGGQIVIGGEVKENNMQYAFDYISNIEKKLDMNGEIQYEVNIRRFSCLDLQDVDRSVAEVLNAENIIRHVNNQKPVAYQAPTITLNKPVGVSFFNPDDPEGTPIIVEEIIAQPGVIQEETDLPETNVPTNQGQPAPQPQLPPAQPNPPVQPGFQPQPFQPQPFQPQPVPQPAQLPAGAQANYGYMPMGFASPTALQLYYCFPGDATVMQYDGSSKRMDELEVGDWIATFHADGGVGYIPVKYWIHRDPNITAEFLEFYLDNGNTFSLTRKHLIYVTQCQFDIKPTDKIDTDPVAAEKVNIGDCFYIAHKGKNRNYQRVRVLDVRTVEKTGIYAPMTSIGTLLVDRIYTSCHSEKDNFTLQNSFWSPLLKIKRKVIDYFWNEKNREGGIGIGANAILAVVDVVLPNKLFF